MAVINSIRDFHSEVSQICSSFENLLPLANSQESAEVFSSISYPIISRLRDLLDSSDSLIS